MSGTKNKLIGLIGLSVLLVSSFVLPAYAAGDANDGGNYVGPRGCKFCHIAQYETWIQTNHSRAFELLVERNETKNENCIPCHTTGWDNKTKTYQFRDVTCEACHGSGDISNNIAENVIHVMYEQNNKSDEEIQSVLVQLNLTKRSMVRNLTAEMCGRCHSGKHNPTYEEWNKSKHAQSLVDLKMNKGAKNECLECHSSEYITAEEHNKPTLDTVTLGNTCQACHSPHITTNTKLLRMPKEKLCESCHYMEGAKPGQAPHHSQSEMRRSFGGIDADTYIYQPNAACADCHRYTWKFNQSGMKEDGITGHDFKINFNVCLKCHEGFPSAEKAEQYVRAQQNEYWQHYNETLVKVKDAGNVTATISGDERAVYNRVFNESLFNLQFAAADKSKGAHNPKYTEELVHKAGIKADNILKGKPEAAQQLPGFDFLTATVMLSFAVLVVAIRRK